MTKNPMSDARRNWLQRKANGFIYAGNSEDEVYLWLITEHTGDEIAREIIRIAIERQPTINKYFENKKTYDNEYFRNEIVKIVFYGIILIIIFAVIYQFI